MAKIVEAKLPKRDALIGGPCLNALTVPRKVRPRVGYRVALHRGRTMAVAALALVRMTPEQMLLADERGQRIENLKPAVVQILAGMQLTTADIDRFICHPGGARVIGALETALSLHQGTLDSERQIIADYGNMSAPTVLFVLERARAAGLPPRSMLTALGPGFTASCVTLRHAA